MNKILESDKPKLRILLLGTQMAIGGAQKVLLDQARWFKSHGHTVAVAFFYDRDGLHEKWQQSVEFPVYNFHVRENNAGFLHQSVNLMAGLWRLWRLLKREQFDVVETFTHDSNILGMPLAWLARVPVRIATHHGTYEGLSLRRKRFHAFLVNANIADTLVVVSDMTKQKALDEGVIAEKIEVIPNGVMPLDISVVKRDKAREDMGLNADDIFLLSVGRLVKEKGYEYLINALPRVGRQFPNIKVGICGDGPLRPQLESQVSNLGLSNSVKLLGVWDDVAPALAIADMFILPSRREGLPIALLEAMVIGLPVIATQIDGIQGVITHGVHGLLVPPEDSDALADSIIQLLEDPDLRKRIGAAARIHVLQNYDTDGMCQKYYELMLKFLNSK